jgi:hypothetical protein
MSPHPLTVKVPSPQCGHVIVGIRAGEPPQFARKLVMILTTAPPRAQAAQISSATIWIAPLGHSATQIPQPLQ